MQMSKTSFRRFGIPERNAGCNKTIELIQIHKTTLLTRVDTKGADLSNMEKSGVYKNKDKENCT